jgi:hypothetical protein
MPDDDDRVFTQEETAAILEVLRQGLDSMGQELAGRLRALRDGWDLHHAELVRQAEVSKRVEALELAPDHELLLYSLVTLPKEAVDLLRKEWFEGPRK